MVRILRFLPTATVSLTLLAACAGPNNSGSSRLSPSATVNARVATKRSGGPTVYAGRWPATNTFVKVFADGGASYLRRVKPGGVVAADSSGYLYVLRTSVAVYKDAGQTLVQTFTTKGGVVTPMDGGVIVADDLGDVYVLGYSNKTHEHIYLYEFEIGKNDPIRTFNVTGMFRCLTTDNSGDLYLALGSNVNVYAPGSTTPERTIHKGLSGPYSMTVDTQGNLYVANITINRKTHLGSIVVYAPGADSPSRTITDGVLDPYIIHTDSSDNLGVLNARPYYNSIPPNVTMYASGSNTPSAVITKGIDAPQSFAFDASNNLYVANQGATDSDLGSITIYQAGSYSLTRTITKNLNHPNSAAVGP
jgi:hypothetical protein